MKLTFEEIRSCTLGAEQVLKTSAGIHFLRFTPEEMLIYRRSNPLWEKTYAAAGIRIAFHTDAEAVKLRFHATRRGSTRSYFAVEVYSDGVPMGVIKNYTDDMDFPAMKERCEAGTFEQRIPLDPKDKLVEIYLPWSKEFILADLDLEKATFFFPAVRRRSLMMYGDSITQGYDTALPSKSYSNRLADALGMEVFNKAIGAECFFPPLANCHPEQRPTIITVAYGSNDWSKRSREELLTNAPLFLEHLLRWHPQARIFVITPIWRKDGQTPTAYGEFSQVAADLEAICKDLPRVTLIRGDDLVPHDTAYFADGRLHPGDEGFEFYLKNLRKQLNV